MTNNEIIKALECCSSVDEFCTDCPLWECERCIKKLTLYSFVFINRQNAEIERLKEKSEKHSDECLSCRRLKTMLNYRVAQIDELHAEIHRLQEEKDHLIKTYKECVLEVVKDFAEKVKEHFNPDSSYEVREHIDNLVKEMGVEG